MQQLPLFGSPLVTALARSSFTTPSGLSVPGILAKCFQEIERKGLDTEGLFRKSGSTAAINQLQSEFEDNKNPFLIQVSPTLSTHSIAGLFKRYLQQLPEPVIPRQWQSSFLNIFDEERCTKETLKRRLKQVCKTLPHEHLHLLQFVMEVAEVIGQHREKNQMTPESLAIIFAPTCIRLDGVSKLMPSEAANSSKFYRSSPSSFASLPALLTKNRLLRKARQFILDTVCKKTLKTGKKEDLTNPFSTVHQKLRWRYQETRNNKRNSYNSSCSLLYKPRDLLQLELVKESSTWIRIFEFMMSYPEVFTTLTNVAVGQKYKPSSASIKPSSVSIEEQKEPETYSFVTDTVPSIEPDTNNYSNLLPTQQEKNTAGDFNHFQFIDANELEKTFSRFEINLDPIAPFNSNTVGGAPITAAQRPPALTIDTSVTAATIKLNLSQDAAVPAKRSSTPVHPPSKYVETLLNWKSREEENPAILFPEHTIATKQDRRVSMAMGVSEKQHHLDWVKAISNSGAAFAATLQSKKKGGNRESLLVANVQQGGGGHVQHQSALC